MSVRDGAGSETVIWSRIIGRVRRRQVPSRVYVDAPLGDAGDLQLVLRARALTPRAAAAGSLWWHDAVIEVGASANVEAPAVPRRASAGRHPQQSSVASAADGGPLISLLTPVHDPSPEMLAAALDSVRRQTLTDWELCLVDDASRDPRVVEMLQQAAAKDARIRLVRRELSAGIAAATNDALSMATGEYVTGFDHDDVLVDDALETIAGTIAERPEADLLYTDEDLILDGRRYELMLKPDWSPDLLRSTMYMCHLFVTRRSLALELGGFRSDFDGSQDYDFILRVSERAGEIVHIPRVLYHWRVHGRSAAAGGTAKPYAYSAARRAVAEHLARTGVDGEVHFGPVPGVYRVIHRVSAGMSVAAVLPVAGDDPAVGEEVAQAAESWARSGFRPQELLLVGAASVVSACVEAADPFSARVVGVEAPNGAGVATLMNLGASAARSGYLLLLDGPVESLTREWLARLVGFAGQPDVGAVGAKMLMSDGRVDNAGILVSDGLPLPLLHGAEAGEFGPLGMARVACNLSAVTGAVAIRRETFVELGGLADALGPLGVVDLCLRARERGTRIVSASDVVVRRTGKRSPPNDLPSLRAFRARWRDRLPQDPYFNPGYYGDRGDLVPRAGVTVGQTGSSASAIRRGCRSIMA